MSELADVIDRLAATIAARRDADPASSWSAKLIADPRLAGKKLAEEAVEAAIAAVAGDRPALVAEAADVLYHLLALLEGAGVSLDSVAAELRRREHHSGVEEKASRKG